MMVLLGPLPIVVVNPGVLFKVHVPVKGKPFSVTLPVDNEQFGGTIVPTMGGVGVAGWALMSKVADTEDTQPEALVTIKV